MSDDLRQRYAEALWRAAEHAITAEWICCDPVKPGHDLCKQATVARRMVRALILDEPEAEPPAELPDAVMAVRDEEMEALRQRVADLERGVKVNGGLYRSAESDVRAAEAALARVDARHAPRPAREVKPCDRHQGDARWTSDAATCPDCTIRPVVVCSNITCCDWPCRDHLALHDETEATCTHKEVDRV